MRFCLLLYVLVLLAGDPMRAGASDAWRVTLPDGVRLILKPETETPVVAVTAFVRLPTDTTPQEEAVGEMVAGALFYGSLYRSFDSIAASVGQVGGSLETLRTPDYIAVTCVTVPAQLNEAVYLLTEALKNANFTPDALQRACKNLLDERRKRDALPFEAACRACGDQLRGLPEAGPELLRRVTQEQAQAYFRSRCVPSRTVIAVVGNFDPDRLEARIDDELSDYDRQPTVRLSAAPVASPPSADLPPTTLLIPGTTACAVVGTPAPDVSSPDYPAFTVLHSLLAGGHAERLFRRLRDTLGLSYDVGALYHADRADPLFAYLQWDTKHASPALSPTTALQRLQSQLDGLLTDSPTDAEINRARNLAVMQDALRHERVRERAFLLGWYETMGLGYPFDAEFPRRLAAVTRADVLRAAKTYLTVHTAAIALPPVK